MPVDFRVHEGNPPVPTRSEAVAKHHSDPLIRRKLAEVAAKAGTELAELGAGAAVPPRKVYKALRRGIEHYSDTSFRKWLAKLADKVGTRAAKLGAGAAKAGKEIVFRALVLYYCLQDNDTPGWARKIVMGALGYLILPADMVPDFLPVVGLWDDLAVVAAAFAVVLVHIKPEHRRTAGEKMEGWFGAEESASPA